MALKFRRGTTAQQSGSLAYGEPYVNTDLGTLLVGGPTGDIVLSTSGTGSTGNFGAISGSGLDITGNANIAGNLTLGGNITIGDAGTDSIVINADLSSSLIPNNDNAFTIGTSALRYSNIYGVNIIGSIGATNGIVSGSSQLNGTTISNLSGSFTGSFKGNLAGVADYGQTVAVSSVGTTTDTTLYPTFTTTAIIGSYSSLYSHSSGSFYYNGVTRQVNAEGFVGGIYATNGVVSGSSQITYASISSIPAGIVSGSSQVTPLLPTGVVSGSAQTIANLPTGTISGSSQITYASISSIPSGIISGSSQLSGTTITDLTVVNLTTVNETASVIFSSGSNRFGDAGNDTHSFTGSVQISGSLTTIGTSTATSYNGTINATNGVVSGSSQITYASISSIPSGIVSGAAQVTPLLPTGTVSGSSQVNFTQLSGISSGIVSSSAQVTPLLPTGTVSGSSQVVGSSITTNTVTVGSTAIALGGSATTIAGLSSVTSTGFTGALTGNASTATTLATARTINGTSFNGSSDITIANLVSGSSQITLSSTTGYGTVINQNLLTTSDVTHNSITAQIRATNGVVSGSSQIVGSAITTNSITIAGTSTALGGAITAEQIRTAIGTVVTGSSQIVGSSITTNTVTVGSTAIALGGSATTIAGLSSVTSTGFTGALTGNASTATTLQTARTINGTSFNGSADITIANLVSGSSQITLSSTTGYGTVINQNLLTTSNVQHASLGIGMAASGTSGRIDAANDVVAFSSSDIRFKENIKPIENALDKISNISGNTYDWKTENKAEHGYEGNDVGVIAQEIEEVLPQLVQTRENGYKAVKYDKLVALLIEGIKEQQITISKLELEVNGLQNVITIFEDRMKEKGLL